MAGCSRRRDRLLSRDDRAVRSRRSRATWTVGDIATWVPNAPLDLIYSNAALHWLDGHAELFPKLRSSLTDGGVLAVQMPDNWESPTHRIPAGVLDQQGWPKAARSALMRDRLSTPEAYAAWLQPSSIDEWRTTYFQRLSGDDPVWTWVTGSVLRPVLAAMTPEDRDRFAEPCRARYRDAYPPATDGTVLLPFSRLFIVARAS